MSNSSLRTIKNLSAGHFCFVSCVGAPWLREDGSILAPLEVTGAPYKKALFHIARDKTEKIIAEKTEEPGSPYLARLGDLLVARSDSFVMDISESEQREGGSYVVHYQKPKLLFYRQGEFRVESSVGEREAAMSARARFGSSEFTNYSFDRGMFLSPDSARLLVTTKLYKVKRKVGLLKNKRTDISFPGLYFWDGKQLSAVPWETALGMDFSTAMKALETKPEHYWSPAQAKTIGLWRINRPVSGVGVLLPSRGTTTALWFVGSGSNDGKLERGPQFQVAGRAVSVANVIEWKSPKEALVELEDGFFLLTKTVDVK